MREARDDDREFLVRALTEAFLNAPETVPAAEQIDLSHRWILESGGAPVATARATPSAQFFLGNKVPSLLIRAVAVAAPFRGTGAGTALMRGVLARARDSGHLASTLYPTVPGVYRRCGYEIAGERTMLRIEPEKLSARATEASIAYMQDGHREGVIACYEAAVRGGSAALCRDERWWNEVVLRSADASMHRYVALENDIVTGYVVCRKHEVEADLKYFYSLEVTDAAWTTPAASDALLAMLRSHQGLGREVRWPARSGDPWAALIGHGVARVHFNYPWMFRLVDVEGALRERGYRAGLDLAIEARVIDDALSENVGAFRLEVSAGSAVVSRIDEAAPVLDVAALASLFTGWADPFALARAGRISGATERDLEAFALVFAAPRPWLSDFF